jgi:plastocyanin
MVAAVVVAAAPAPALADKEIRANTVWMFDAMSYTIDQGEALSFLNADAASPGPHNVTASSNGPDGKPFFASKTIAHGETAPVDGARQLVTGTYPFICSVHPFMQADLVVTDKGAPVSTGGAPAPNPTPAPTPAPSDTRPPAVTVTLGRTTLAKARKAKRFSAVVLSDEPAALRLRLSARIGKRTVSLATATAKIARASGRASVVLRLSAKALRALRKARSARITLAVEGRDGAGNVGTATARATYAR